MVVLPRINWSRFQILLDKLIKYMHLLSFWPRMKSQIINVIHEYVNAFVHSTLWISSLNKRKIMNSTIFNWIIRLMGNWIIIANNCFKNGERRKCDFVVKLKLNNDSRMLVTWHVYGVSFSNWRAIFLFNVCMQSGQLKPIASQKIKTKLWKWSSLLIYRICIRRKEIYAIDAWIIEENTIGKKPNNAKNSRQ